MDSTNEAPLLAEGRTAKLFAWGKGRVLKLYRPGFAADVARHEADCAGAALAAGLPTPAVLDLIEQDGQAGIVFQQVEGTTMLQEIIESPEKLAPYTRLLAELHASMHDHAATDLPSLKACLRRKVERARPLPEAWRRAVLTHLDALPDGDAICHGDFHPDNVMMTKTGPVIIDWIDAARGHPLADVARTLLLTGHGAPLPAADAPTSQQMDDIRRRFADIYLSRYKELRPFEPAELSVWRLPVAAARLEEGIAEEKATLLKFVETSLSNIPGIPYDEIMGNA